MQLERFTFLLGLPALRPGPLWKQATALRAPILVSANALSIWVRDGLDLRRWERFDGRHLGLVSTYPVALDSAGFVAARLYRGFPWPVDAYLDLAAAAPWLWWAAADWCVEPEIAGDHERSSTESPAPSASTSFASTAATAEASPIASCRRSRAGIPTTTSAVSSECPGCWTGP